MQILACKLSSHNHKDHTQSLCFIPKQRFPKTEIKKKKKKRNSFSWLEEYTIPFLNQAEGKTPYQIGFPLRTTSFVCWVSEILSMGDHFVLLVDRLLTESTLEAAIESKNRLIQSSDSATGESKISNSSQNMDFGNISFPRKLVECRICHDEEEDFNMETPCSCCGSLKYAHRRCVQRWCNEKGDTTCEICHQQFKPGYTAPPPLFQFGRIPMNFRGNWEISRRDINRPRIIAMVSTDRNFLDPDYDDYTASTARSAFCCRSIAFIFMVLLILRHTLPLIISGNTDYSFPLLLLLFLRTAGVVLPIYVVVKAVTAIQRRRTQQELPVSSITSSEEETTEHLTLQPQPHILHV